jgi:uncharacterized protein YjbI with pentapeptide repeats
MKDINNYQRLLPVKQPIKTQAVIAQPPSPTVQPANPDSFLGLGWPQWLAVVAGATGVWNGHKIYDRAIAPVQNRQYYAQLQDTVINDPKQSPLERNRAFSWRYFWRIGQRKDGKPALTHPTIVRSTQEGITKHNSTLTDDVAARYPRVNNHSYYPSHKSALASNDNSVLRLPGRWMPPVAQLFKPTPNKGLKFTLRPGYQLHPPANLSGSYPNDVNHDDGNLSNSHLPGLLLDNTSAKRLNLSGANVPGADFSKTNLFKAFVKNAHIAGSKLWDTIGLPSLGLEMLDKHMVNLQIGSTDPKNPMSLTRQNLSEKNLQGLLAKYIDLMDTLLKKSNLQKANLQDKNSVRLLGANMEAIQGQQMQAANQDFAVVPMWNSNLQGIDAPNSDFSGTDLSAETGHKLTQLANRQARKKAIQPVNNTQPKDQPLPNGIMLKHLPVAQTAYRPDPEPLKRPPNLSGITRKIGPKTFVIKKTNLANSNMRGQVLDGQNLSYTILDGLQVQPLPPLTDKQAQVQYRDVLAYLRQFMLTNRERKMFNSQLIRELSVPVSKLKTKLLDLAKAEHLDNTNKQLAEPELSNASARLIIDNARKYDDVLRDYAKEKVQLQHRLAKEGRLTKQAHNARSASFIGTNLSRSSLRFIDFSGLNLSNANLSYSNLEGSSFSSDTNVKGLNMTGCINVNWGQLFRHPDREYIILDKTQELQ